MSELGISYATLQLNKEEYRTLYIGILGNNKMQSEDILKSIVNNNKDMIIQVARDKVISSDRTVYYALSNCDNIISIRLDQLIVEQTSEINPNIYSLLCASCVPEEFQIQKYIY